MNPNKRLAVKLGIACCGALSAVLMGCAQSGEHPRDAGVQVELSVQTDTAYATIRTESDFIEPLSPYGRWEVVGSYGRCWIPNGVESDWSPYSNGSWQQTDEGWYWVTDEPWGWATYHYGRWDRSPQFGWYWVPQTQWAPAWVSWREGGGYVGWAPLGPSGREVAESNARGYVFVDEHHFTEPIRPRAAIVNNTVINKTVVITNTHVVNQTVINEGPSTTVIEKARGQKMQAVPVRQLRTKEEAKVVARHAAPAPATAKTVTTPAPRQAEKTLPARVTPQAGNPPTAAAAPQAPVAKNETRQADADAQGRVAKLDEEKRALQAAAQQKEGERPEAAKSASVPEARPAAKSEPKPEVKPEARPEARPEPKPEVKPEPKPEARPEARPEVKPENKPETKPAAQAEAKPKAKPEPKPETRPAPEAKAESNPASEQPAATAEPNGRKPEKDDEKKD